MLTSIQVTPNTLKRLDFIRKQRGIRTRAKAMEVVLEEFMQSDPLEVLLDSPKSSDPIPKHILEAVKTDKEIRATGKKVKTTPHTAVKARLEERRKNAA